MHCNSGYYDVTKDLTIWGLCGFRVGILQFCPVCSLWTSRAVGSAYSGSTCCIAGGSAPPPGSPTGVGVAVRCGGPPISSAPTEGPARCGWVGSADVAASLFASCAASWAWPSDTGGGPGRLPGRAGCEAPAGTVVRAGSGLGSRPGGRTTR